MSKRFWLAVVLCVFSTHDKVLAQTVTEWTGAIGNNFFDDGNWTNGAPGSLDSHAIIDGGGNLPATIPADVGTVEIGAVSLGVFDGGGHVVQNGGTFVIFGDDIGLESQIGDAAEESSSWIMNGNSVILYDDPLGGDGDGLDSDGTGKDFDVGKNNLEGSVGRLELHDNAILRISDDLKIADGNDGHAEVRLDGNSQLSVGSGISASGTNSVTVSGNALLLSGNSAGPGAMDVGRTDEGYFTLSTSGGEEANINVQESGRVYIRTLQQRGGISTINVEDNGQFHVFDVFENESPDAGNATVTGSASGPQRTSHVSSSADAETYINLSGNASFSVDSDLEDSGWTGLALSGGTNRGANSAGGTTEVNISEQATFTVAQDLHLTLGTGEDATSTLSVQGPNASVSVGGDLRMALDDFDVENPGEAVLQAILTASSHSEINVTGTAFIGNGGLQVVFADYTPNGGETYSLLSAGNIDGNGFREVDLPELADGLSWDLVINNNSIVLNILGGGLVGDFDQSGVLDVNDINQLTVVSASKTNDETFDLNGDQVVDNLDVNSWVKDLANSWIGDANLDGEFNSSDFVAVFQGGLFETDQPAKWSLGDWNGDGRFNSSDFVVAFQDGGFELGPRNGIAAVPEPGAMVLLLGALGLVGPFRRCRS